MLTKRHLFVLGCALALVIAVSLAGCNLALRKRVLQGVGRVVASPTLPTLISEVASILLSDEWRDQLEKKARKHGRARVRAAVEANAREPATAAAETSAGVVPPLGDPLRVNARGGVVVIPPDVIIRSRALLWLADDDRASRAQPPETEGER